MKRKGKGTDAQPPNAAPTGTRPNPDQHESWRGGDFYRKAFTAIEFSKGRTFRKESKKKTKTPNAMGGLKPRSGWECFLSGNQPRRATRNRVIESMRGGWEMVSMGELGDSGKIQESTVERRAKTRGGVASGKGGNRSPRGRR